MLFISIVFSSCSLKKAVNSNIHFINGSKSNVVSDTTSDADMAADIIKSYSAGNLGFSVKEDYSLFLSSKTAVYKEENYYKIAVGNAVLNDFGYYEIEEIFCFLVSLQGNKVYSYDKTTDMLNIIDSDCKILEID